MGNALAEGAATRSEIALWLLKERFPDWELALIGVSEFHSAIEALWHGIDERHPLHSHSSSRAAAESVHKIYRAMDQLIGTLAEEFEDATILVFSMHGMGAEPFRCAGPWCFCQSFYTVYAFGRFFFKQPDSLDAALRMVCRFSGKRTTWNVVTPDLTWMALSIGEHLVRRARGQAARFLPE